MLLLVANGEFALGLLVVVGEVFELAGCVVLHHSVAELDVALGVFVARLLWEGILVNSRDSEAGGLDSRRLWCRQGVQLGLH